jgi:hypothetical protein
MPVKLCVALSRKVGEPNYGSRGGSIQLEVEINSAVIADQHRLHMHIRQVFALVRAALAEEMDGHGRTVMVPQRCETAATTTTTAYRWRRSRKRKRSARSPSGTASTCGSSCASAAR